MLEDEDEHEHADEGRQHSRNLGLIKRTNS
jgi:hypothetical protein